MNQQDVLIIGGSSGIGHEVARQANERGARVIIVGRDATRLAAAAKLIGGAVRTVALDAHDEPALVSFLSDLEPVDHVVSMVGDSMAGGFLSTTPDIMRHVLHSKFWTNWTIARTVAATVRMGGSITITSGTGGQPHDVSATYVANLGIGALVQGLASELAPAVRVNAVAPTFMDTPFWSDLPRTEFEAVKAGVIDRIPLGRLGTVEEVASTYIHLMTNGFITGQVLAVDGGVMLRK
jgi:NAD(P)-dependent dehydrogenase (short-subunit alcohol dehydrogenase family)